MESRQSQSSDQDTSERDLALLRTRLRRWDDEHRDIIDDLRRLRSIDPLADEAIRHFTEKYFPGVEDIRRKAKAVRMLTAAFLVLVDTRRSLYDTDIASPGVNLHTDQDKTIG